MCIISFTHNSDSEIGLFGSVYMLWGWIVPVLNADTRSSLENSAQPWIPLE